MKSKLKKIYDFLIEVLILWVFWCAFVVALVILKLFPEVAAVALAGAIAAVALDKISNKKE